jgi:hypothetical protein
MPFIFSFSVVSEIMAAAAVSYADMLYAGFFSFAAAVEPPLPHKGQYSL